MDLISTKSSSKKSKNEESIQIDLEPILEDKKFSEAIWFNFSKKPKGIQPNGQTKGKSIDTPFKRWGHSSCLYKNSLIIFGGRHSTRSLVSIHAFDLENIFWYKIDALGQTPAARDSHSAVIVSFSNLLIFNKYRKINLNQINKLFSF